MAVTLMSALLIIIGNLLADLAYAWVDPRIRYE
jgi:peptide/nickel transport system permease protein